MLRGMILEILGSGTSTGVPVPACKCKVCTSTDPADKRLRASALLRSNDDGAVILIDSGPDFRVQALRSNLTRLDAVLVTHSHADHIHGMDDLRIFSYKNALPVFSNAECIADIEVRFDYVFKKTQEGGGKPKFELETAKPGKPLFIAGAKIIPIPLAHGELETTGWRVGDTAYLTDCSSLPDEAFPLLEGIRNLVIDGLRLTPHPTHFNFEQAAENGARTGAENIWFTHIGHECLHSEIISWCAKKQAEKTAETGRNIRLVPAFDELKIPVTL